MPDGVKTATAGAEPVKEEITAHPGSEPGKDANSDPSTEKVPFDKDPRWKSARLAEKKLTELMKVNDVEDPDELVELVSKGKAIKGKVEDVNSLDDILSKAKKLEKYEAYWKEQEELKRRQNEDPDETIKRLERELKQRDQFFNTEKARKEEAEKAGKAVKFYESNVSDLLEDEVIPKERKAVMAEFLGIGNQANDIDITDRKAIKRIYQDAVKKFEAYEQAVIQNYLAGKSKVPVVSKTEETVVDKDKPIKNLKEAREIFRDRMSKMSGG